MKLVETIKMALSGVSTNKFRSFLTLLGIIIGVGAVIIMVSLGSGTQKVVSGQFGSLYTRQIWIGPNYMLPYHLQGKFTLEDEQYLEATTIGTENAVPFYTFYFDVRYGEKSASTTVAGVVPESGEVTNLEVQYGRFIEESDVKNREKVAVVGESFLARISDVTDYSTLIGKDIYVDGKELLIVGILKRSSTTVALPDSVVLIPITTVQQLWRRQTRTLDFFLLTYDEKTSEQDIISQVEYLLNKKYGQTADGKSKFRIEGLAQQADMMKTVVRVFTYVLGGIAAISLLVGGIGVMNIMLVNVKERTREIGIRLAIGATRKDIQKQFLMEAIILSVGGGLLGIIGGSLISFAVNIILGRFFTWWQGTIPPEIIVLSFGVTASIGIIFGFYPAFKASKLNPIEALRYE